jgi:CDP-diacylglycerol--serine O-phosphatidyltransferase
MKKKRPQRFLKKTREHSLAFFNHTKEKTREIIERTRFAKFLQREKMIAFKNKVFELRLYIADAFSFLNLSSGLASIFASINHKYTLAVLFILLGVFFDAFDGKIARHFKRETLLGLQLDSLADLVTFSLAIIVLFNVMFSFALPILIISFVHISAGAFRLARYNVIKLKDPDNKVYLGTPITWNGILFPIAYFCHASLWVIAGLLLLMGVLMISTIKIKKVI